MKQIITLFIVASITSCSMKPILVGKHHQLVPGNGHKCPFKMCPMKGQRHFSGCHTDLCYRGTDCYVMDSLHWEHPRMSYDKLDSIYNLTIK